MKKFVSALVMTMAASGCAHAQTNEQVWGTLIGGGLGYVFGDGSGHQKEIAAASAVGGLLLGTHASRPRYERVYTSQPVYAEPVYRGSYSSAGAVCASNVPPNYAYNDGARSAWVRGCISRMQQQQYELEQEAYEAGAQ
jgi:uncharacterized protein YcfJ